MDWNSKFDKSVYLQSLHMCHVSSSEDTILLIYSSYILYLRTHERSKCKAQFYFNSINVFTTCSL